MRDFFGCLILGLLWWFTFGGFFLVRWEELEVVSLGEYRFVGVVSYCETVSPLWTCGVVNCSTKQ